MRIALLVYVNLDPVPGAFHTEESALNNLRGVLENQIGHYNPVVAYPPDTLEVPTEVGGRRRAEAERRRAFVAFVDLDPMLGSMNTRNSARRVVRDLLRDVIFHYSPVVSIAPADLQPATTEGNVTA